MSKQMPYKPFRETPVASEEEIHRMLERLRRRCKVGKVSVDLAPASSAGPPSPASASVVSGAAGITATAGGGPHEAVPSSPPFQPTRSAPNQSPSILDENGNHGSDLLLGDAGAERRSIRPGGPLDGLGSGCALAPSRPALQWERISPTAMRTTCGIWTCCRVTIGGVHSYELWRRVAGLERPIPVPPSLPNFDLAKQAAQDEMDADNG